MDFFVWQVYGNVQEQLDVMEKEEKENANTKVIYIFTHHSSLITHSPTHSHSHTMMLLTPHSHTMMLLTPHS